jgi:hypothetical protein
LSGIGTWRDFDSLYLCLVSNALALVLSVLAENLDALKCGGWGGIYSPNHQSGRWEGCCQRAHRTVQCATGHCPVRQPRHPTVRVRPLELLTTQPSDSPVVHRAVTVHCLVRLLMPAMTSAHVGTHCSVSLFLCIRLLALYSRYSVGTPDSPVLHRTVR